MSLRLHRMWLLPLLFIASQTWALGLGDIKLDSALNQPLRAEIELLASTLEELNNLEIQLASVETFRRYDLDRPLYLTDIKFELVRTGRADGNYIRVTSANSISEPFITFLVEAVWSRGRLLREYTLLLDPPTFAPPPVSQAAQDVTAPRRVTPTDSGQIQRPAAQPPVATEAPAQPRAAVQAPSRVSPPPPPPEPEVAEPAPRPAPAPPARPETTPPPANVAGQTSFNTEQGDDLLVHRGDTLWGITRRVRPDSRLTINQTMLAIYEANPEAFEGNINRLRAGAILRIPSANDVFRITRGDAFSEVKRQNEDWGGLPDRASAASSAPITAVDEAPQNLTLVPPDEDLSLTDTSSTSGDSDADVSSIDPDEARIQELEALFENQDSLIEIEDNELAALRAELARLRGEEPLPVDELVDDEAFTADDESLLSDEESDLLDDGILDDAIDDAAADEVDTPAVSAPAVVVAPARDEPGMVATIVGYLGNFWVIIGLALAAAIGLLVWFMRRSGGEETGDTGVWETFTVDDQDAETLVATTEISTQERFDETSILVEEARAPRAAESTANDTLEAPGPAQTMSPDTGIDFNADSLAATGTNKSLEDTFSSETAINLDQSDPVAEADFHMAYGLYDQAADLINGALAAQPGDANLLSKLCEIYFVWGNQDAFVDAAGQLKTVIGDTVSADWDKIVIMGQQIAADHELFSGVSAGAATKAVDLSFDTDDDAVAALDMDLDMDLAEGAVADASDIIDLGAEDGVDDERTGNRNAGLDIDFGADVGDDTGQVLIAADASSIDFSFDEADGATDLEASVTREMPDLNEEATADSPILDAEQTSEPTVETPTIEQQFESFDLTGELPTLDEADIDLAAKPADAALATDATAEINLDDLGLDLESLVDSSLVDDINDTVENQTLEIVSALAETGTETDFGLSDELEKTGANPALAGMDTAADEDSDATGLQNILPDLYLPEDTDIGIDTSLLDATGQTQVLSEDMIVDAAATGRHESATEMSPDDDDKTMLAPVLSDDKDVAELPDDAATMLASLDDDDELDYSKTEALPKGVFSADMSDGLSLDDTGRLEVLSATDMDLDLDDLTAALKVSEVGDTISEARDDATVEQPLISPDAVDLDVGELLGDVSDGGTTQALAADELGEDLLDARTMTEVGTKLDLARAYVDMGDPSGARSILEEVLDEGDEGQRQQAQKLIDSLPS